MNDDDRDSSKSDFARLLGGVKTITSDRVVHNQPKPRPIPKQAKLDEQRVMDELFISSVEHEEMQAGDVLSYAQDGLQVKAFKKLKRGQYRIEAECDLHGMTRIEAQQHLNEFISEARQLGIRCVRIIHGKGYGSSNQGPVIKPLVNTWLRKRKEILAFCSARPADGGTGAVYVLIKLA